MAKKHLENAKGFFLNKLLDELNIEQQYNVIAVNFECIQKSKYNEIEIKDGYEIEILSPMQGG